MAKTSSSGSLLNDFLANGRSLAEVRGEEPAELHLSLWDVFMRTAIKHPEREALVSCWQSKGPKPFAIYQANDSEGEGKLLKWTYCELKQKAELLAAHLRALGCQQGMRLAAILFNSAEWSLFFWTSAQLGMTFVPLDPTVDTHELRTILNSLQAHVIVVQDAQAAIELNDLEVQIEPPTLRFQCSRQHIAGWIRLCEVSWLSGTRKAIPTNGVTIEDHPDGNGCATPKHVALVVYTSGTTGTSKGCQHTDRNLISQSCDFDPEPESSVVHRWLVHTPTFHIFAVNNALRAWRYGGVVIFPAKSFSVDSTLNALINERCSIMSATPTLLKALLAHPSFPDRKKLNLHLVTIGGTTIGHEDIRLCCQGLGAEYAIQVYGMSESGPLISWTRSDPMLVDGYHPGVGKVLPGGAARICQPGTRKVLRRCEVGELHIGGSSVIQSYTAEDDNGAFYDDGMDRWLVTGDQAQIDEKGVIHIHGRYKDLIIRGGENISPAKIESILNELTGSQVSSRQW